MARSWTPCLWERDVACFFFPNKDGLRSSVAGFAEGDTQPMAVGILPTVVDRQPTLLVKSVWPSDVSQVKLVKLADDGLQLLLAGALWRSEGNGGQQFFWGGGLNPKSRKKNFLSKNITRSIKLISEMC